MFPTRPISSVPTITKAQMVEVDRVMVDDLGIGLIQMMENAGRNLARFTMAAYLEPDVADSVVVLAGSGGNGGGGIVAARRLSGWDVPVSVWLTKPPGEYRGIIADQLRALMRLGVTVEDESLPRSSGGGDIVILDCLVGYSLAGAPRGRVADLIRWARSIDAPVVSLDVPSGVDSTTGEVLDPTVVASATMTLALPKTGLVAPRAAGNVGELYVADIAVPASLYRDAFNLDIGDLFIDADIVSLTADEELVAENAEDLSSYG